MNDKKLYQTLLPVLQPIVRSFFPNFEIEVYTGKHTLQTFIDVCAADRAEWVGFFSDIPYWAFENAASKAVQNDAVRTICELKKQPRFAKLFLGHAAGISGSERMIAEFGAIDEDVVCGAIAGGHTTLAKKEFWSDYTKNRCLRETARHGRIELMKYYLERITDPDVDTAISIATDAGHTDAVALLTKYKK